MGENNLFGKSLIFTVPSAHQNPPQTISGNTPKYTLEHASDNQKTTQPTQVRIEQTSNNSREQLASRETVKPILALSPETNKILDNLFGAFPNQEQQHKIDWLKNEIIKSPLLTENLNQAVSNKQVTNIKLDVTETTEINAVGLYKSNGVILLNQDRFNHQYKEKNLPLLLISTLGHEIYHAITRQQLLDFESQFKKQITKNEAHNQDLTEPIVSYLNKNINYEARAEMEAYNCLNDYLRTLYPNSTPQERMQLMTKGENMFTMPANVDSYNRITQFYPEMIDADGFAIPSKAQAHFITAYAEAQHYPENILTNVFSTLKPNMRVDLAKLGLNENQIKENREYTYEKHQIVIDISDPNRPCKADFGKNEAQCKPTEMIIQKQLMYKTLPDDQAIPTPRDIKLANQLSNPINQSTNKDSRLDQQLLQNIIDNQAPSAFGSYNQMNMIGK